MNFRTKLTSAVVVLCVLSFVASVCVFAAEGTKVLGKATITKGTTLPGMSMINDTQGLGFTFVAFEDQELYIIDKVAADPGIHKGGYILQADGFQHACPTHGLETINMGKIVLPIELVEDGTITIILYEELGTIKKEG